MPSRLFSVARSFVPPVHSSFILSLPIDASLKKLNRSLKISRFFPSLGSEEQASNKTVIAPKVTGSFLLLLRKFLTLGCYAKSSNYPIFPAWKDILSLPHSLGWEYSKW
jgi:hypothetical protein